MATQQLNAIIKVTDQATWPLKKFGSSLDSFGSKMQWLVAWIGAIGAIGWTAIVWLWMATIWIAGKFEKFQSILTNTLWSVSDAKDAMALLKDVSSKTPFELDKLTESYIKLANRWFKPTREQITSLWDLAASQWKDFDMLTEALLDAQTGEFERLKEFWVKAQVSGDKVAFTFKGVTTTVGKSDEAIKNYILSLWNLKWVQGSMIVQSDTYEWRVSNLKDAWTNLSATIGDKFLPISKKSVSALTETINKLNESVSAISAWWESSNWYILLVANALKNLWAAGLNIPSIGDMMSIAMKKVVASIIPWLWPIELLTGKLNDLLKLAGIDIGGMVVGAAQNAVTAKASEIATNLGQQQGLLTKLQSSWSAALSPNNNATESLAKIKAREVKQNTKFTLPSSKLGWWSKVDKQQDAQEVQVRQEKELIKVTEERIKQVNSLGISETKKSQLIIQINEETQQEIKKIRWDDQKDSLNYFDQIASKAKEKLEVVKDKFKGIYETVKDSISKSKDEVWKLEDKIKDGLERIQKLQDSFKQIWSDTQTSLTDRFVEITKELADIQKQWFNFVDGNGAEQLQKQQDLLREIEVINGKVDKQTLDKWIAFDKLSPAEKILAKAEEKKAELQLEIDSEKEKVELLEAERKEELSKMNTFNIAKAKVEKDYTRLFKEQLDQRSQAYATFIKTMESLSWSSKFVVDKAVSTELTWARALWWTIQAGKNYLVWENWPEIISSLTTRTVNNNISDKSVSSVDNKTSSSTSVSNKVGPTVVNINMGWVVVTKEADENRLLDSMKRMLINEAKLYNYGIT